jgi:hypothetical protein
MHIPPSCLRAFVVIPAILPERHFAVQCHTQSGWSFAAFFTSDWPPSSRKFQATE